MEGLAILIEVNQNPSPQGSTVLRIERLSKRYRLGTIGFGSLQSDLASLWARVRGKEDPNSTIGEESRLRQKGEFYALHDVSFDVEAGDRVAVVGRNGAGKSTLLKILSRVTSPTSGSIRVKGRVASLLEVGTGFHPELTGRENVYLNGAILGMKRDEIQRKLDEIVDFSGVGRFLDTPVKRYSSGMYVRLAFSVAAHLDSDILLIDEVLAVGDVEFQKKCINKMENLSTGAGKTIVFVSHNIAMLQVLCNKGIFLKGGAVAHPISSIEKTIDAYLRDVYDGRGAGDWQDTANAYFHEAFAPRRMRLFKEDDNTSPTQFRNDESIAVEISGLITKPDRNLIVGVNVLDQNGQVIFQSHFKDIAERDWPNLSSGEYTFSLTFPRRTLNEGTYRVELLAFLINPWTYIVPVHGGAPGVELTIYGGMSDSPLNTEKRAGVLALMLPWEVRRVR